MVEGAVRHGTSMQLEGNYVDSHGQSEIGFAITSLLDFDLLPRIKRINKIKLYGPDQETFLRLTPAMTRAIRWDLIEQNYDQMIKFATAIRVGPPQPKPSCAASPATPPTPSTKPCWNSAEPRGPSSCADTWATATSRVKSRRASTSSSPGTGSTR